MKNDVKSTELTARLMIRSNWGDAHRVGLTEIQFLDRKKRKIPVVLSAVSMNGAPSATGELLSLFNGKCKVRLHT